MLQPYYYLLTVYVTVGKYSEFTQDKINSSVLFDKIDGI